MLLLVAGVIKQPHYSNRFLTIWSFLWQPWTNTNCAMRISKEHANMRYQNLSSIFSRVPGVKESSAMGAPVLIFSMVAVFNDLPSMAVFSGVWAQGPWWRRESWISLLHAALSISHSFGYWKAKCSWQIIVDVSWAITVIASFVKILCFKKGQLQKTPKPLTILFID